MQHHKIKSGFKYGSRWRYGSALMLTYGRASNVSSNVLQKASPLCDALHPEKTHLTWLLHQTSGRAALKSPTVPWPRLRCKKRGIKPTMSSEHRWERARGGFTFRQSEHKKRNGNNFFFKKARLDLNPSRSVELVQRLTASLCRQKVRRLQATGSPVPTIPASIELIFDTSKNGERCKGAVWGR